MTEKNLFNECSRKIEHVKKANMEFRSLIPAFNYLAQGHLFLMSFIENDELKKDLDFYLLAYKIYLTGFKNFLDYFNVKIEPLLFIGVLLQKIKDHANLADILKEELHYLKISIKINDNVHNIVTKTFDAENPLKSRIITQAKFGAYYAPLKNFAHVIFLLYLILDMGETNFIEQKVHKTCLHCLLAGIEIILQSINNHEAPMDFVENLLRKIGISPDELGIGFPKKGSES